MNQLKYLSRCIFRNIPRITDYQFFPSAPIRKGEQVLPLPYANNWEPPLINYQVKRQEKSSALLPLLNSTGTTAFIVLQHNKILLEHYSNGYTETSINTSFSVAKSMISILVGIAIEEGFIQNVEDPVGKYIPHYNQGALKDITITHLLTMSSGLAYREGVTPWSDDGKVYYGLQLREQALKTRLAEQPGSTYHYNNYNLLLLGLILEKTTGRSVPQYFEEKIWKHIGAEADASWSLDSRASGFAKMETGFNARARDFLRFGLLCLQQGRIGSTQVFPSAWLQEAVSPPRQQPDTQPYMKRQSPPLSRWAASPHGYYKYLWWGWKIDHSLPDYFALGVKGQLIYICPRSQAVIIRFGKKWGQVDWWPAILKQVADSLT